MIRRLQLHQWRSYEHLDVEFGEGTTFIVSPNAVGKTSLVMALAWAVYGDDSGVAARDCVRAGADEAWVQVDMALPSGSLLSVRREIPLRGRQRVAVTLDGAKIPAKDLPAVYATEFKVPAPIAARLSLMASAGGHSSGQTLNLEDHLYRAFGVQDLVANAKLARAAARQATRAREALGKTVKERLENRMAVEADITSLKDRLAVARDEAVELERRFSEMDRQRQKAMRLAGRHERLRSSEALFHELIQQARSAADVLVGESAEPGDLAAELATSIIDAQAHLDEAVEADIAARAAASAARTALGLLEGPNAACPTCLRAIGDDEHTRAVADHRQRLHAAEADARRHAEATRAYRERLDALHSILAKLEQLEVPQVDIRPEHIPPIGQLDREHAELREQLADANREAGRIEGELEQREHLLSEDDRAVQQDRQLVRGYRQEAVAEAAARALEAAADRTVEALIEPIKSEVRWRWKRLFQDDGLTLKADGSMVRIIEGRELGWESLSGGEQTWARIVAHLLILASSTQLPFAWFDEPLERLDPKFRHSVAATLATATQSRHPRQLIVTTYENALANQLADDVLDAHVINVRQASNWTSTPAATSSRRSPTSS